MALLLGMNDSETAELFGGGEENWTEDRLFYIGRVFQAEVYGETYPLYTSCGDDGTVEAVSMWIVSGERQVTDEEVEEWIARISEYMSTEPSYDGETSEAGSKSWKWIKDGKAASMYQMEDILTVSVQPAIGELN